MDKENFMNKCREKEDEHQCEINWEKHLRETAPTSEFGIGNTRFKTNSRTFQIILFIIFLLIVGIGIYLLLRFNNLV